MSAQVVFDDAFRELTGYRPMAWQRRLFEDYLARGTLPEACDLPTGLGKTSILALWLIAIARQCEEAGQPALPRRLVYVVNRRTVVDQATAEAEGLRAALRVNQLSPCLAAIRDALLRVCLDPDDEASPLAISTLRGQLADNSQWRADPARPAIIIGTVDMIGSRLLFSAYGRGFKSRPLHAGFLGQDALVVHDEAHLEPAFQSLLESVQSEQQRCRELRPLRVMALSATARSCGHAFGLSEEDATNDPLVSQRVNARKRMRLHWVKEQKQVPEQVAELALTFKDNNRAILVFLRKVADVERAVSQLRSAGQTVQALTGTLRGLERDLLAREDPVFARFLPKPRVTPASATVYLVCTSAGEVGVNISADDLVCDLTPFDSMAQRLGRVNRFGVGEARVEVVHAIAPGSTGSERSDEVGESPKAKTLSPYDAACGNAFRLIERLPILDDGTRDASPAALSSLLQGVVSGDRAAAFTPPPQVRPATDILFDAWALTTVRQDLPGRPPVAEWLHGVAEWEPEHTCVAWRLEVGLLTGAILEMSTPAELLDDYPLKPHEILRDTTERVRGHLEAVAARCPTAPVWLVDPRGSVSVMLLATLVERGPRKNPKIPLAECTVLLPPEVGGLDGGVLSGTTTVGDRGVLDVADRLRDDNGQPLRARTWGDDAPEGMRVVRSFRL